MPGNMQEDAYARADQTGSFVQVPHSQELAGSVIERRWSADCVNTSATPISAGTYDLPTADIPSIDLCNVDGAWTLLSCFGGARAGT